MITVSNTNLPTLPSTIPQPQQRRHGNGGRSGPRWNDVLQHGAAAPGETETVEEPVAASPAAHSGSINILA